MPRTLFVTKGEYAGRYMRLEDDVAKKALSDGWARENEAEPEEFDPAAEPKPPEELPASLEEFEEADDIDETDETEDDSDDNDSDTPKKTRKYTKRRS